MFDEPEAEEPEEPKQPEVWTNYRIYGSNDGGLYVDWETNDDNDDGYPDPKTVRANFGPYSDLQKALRVMTHGGSRYGAFGQRVSVYFQGRQIWTNPQWDAKLPMQIFYDEGLEVCE